MNIYGAQHVATAWAALPLSSQSGPRNADAGAQPPVGEVRSIGRAAEPSRDTVSLSALGQQLSSRDFAASLEQGGSVARQSQNAYDANGKAQAEAQPPSAINGGGDIDKANEQAREQADERSIKQSIENKKEQQAEAQKQEAIRDLAARDREVRAHEQAHAAVGGSFAGAPKYQYERGPDGVNYAVGGEVPIDVSPAATPEQTIAKAQTIRRAALAPAEPSPQDRRVAQESTRLEAEARQEMRAESAASAASIEAKQGANLETAQAGESATQGANQAVSANNTASLAPVGALPPDAQPELQGASFNASSSNVSSSTMSSISSADSTRSSVNNGADTYRTLSRLTGEASNNGTLARANNSQPTLLDAMA
ncbi:MAG TPA: putative metalloprotease CJM1_0395 family protein [Marinagarivorans sp.]